MTRAYSHIQIQEKAKAIASYLDQGLSLTKSCALASITPRTVRKWIDTGRESDADEDSIYRYVVDLTDRAVATHAQRMLQHVEGAAPEDWRAAAWLLERRHAKDFKQQSGLEHEVRTKLVSYVAGPAPQKEE